MHKNNLAREKVKNMIKVTSKYESNSIKTNKVVHFNL